MTKAQVWLWHFRILNSPGRLFGFPLNVSALAGRVGDGFRFGLAELALSAARIPSVPIVALLGLVRAAATIFWLLVFGVNEERYP